MKRQIGNRRLARAARTRHIQRRLGVTRVVVHLTNKHTYAQIISSEAAVLAHASTAEKEVRGRLKSGANTAAAQLVGQRLAEKAKALTAEHLAALGFDRGGRRYTGRVRALAEAARGGGLSF